MFCRLFFVYFLLVFSCIAIPNRPDGIPIAIWNIILSLYNERWHELSVSGRNQSESMKQSVIEHCIFGAPGNNGGHFFTTKDAIRANEQKIILKSDLGIVDLLSCNENVLLFRSKMETFATDLKRYFSNIFDIISEYDITIDRSRRFWITIQIKLPNATHPIEIQNQTIAGYRLDTLLSAYKHIKGFIIGIAEDRKIPGVYRLASVAPILCD